MKLVKQSYVKYGLIMSGLVVFCLLLMELLGQNESFEKSPLVGLWTFVLPAVVWFLGIRAKKKLLKNKLSFKQGLTEGFKISLIFAITSPFVFLAYYLFVNPAILEYVSDAYGLTNADTTMVIATDMFVQFVSAIIFGTLYAAIISLFLKSKKSS